MDWQKSNDFDNREARIESLKKAILPAVIIIALLIASLLVFDYARTIGKSITFKDVSYTHKVKYIKISSTIGRVAYIDEGSADNTIVFIHGIGVYLKFFKLQIDYLRKKYRVIALDMPGYGKSDFKNGLKYGLELHTKSVEILIKKLNIKNPIIAGHSYGGMVALNLTANYNISARKLILISPAGLLELNSRDIKFLLELTDDENRIVIPEEAERAFNANIFKHNNFTKAMRKEYSSLIRAGEYKKFYKTRIRVLKDIIPRFSTFYENLKYLRIPILLIAGEEDHVVPIFKVSGYLSGGFPRAITFFPSLERNHINLSVKMIKNCGHMPIIEHPDIVNKYIDRFISK